MGKILVFGGGGGIGAAVVARVKGRGESRVVVAGRNQEAQEATGADQNLVVGDLLAANAVDEAFSAAEADGPITGVVAAVGSILLKPAHATSDADFDDTIARNLTFAFRVLRAAAKRRETLKSLVLFSSAAASVGLPNHEAIAAAKAGIEGLVRSAAATYASAGLRVNAVAPGLVRTKLAGRITGNPAALAASTAMHPLGRIGEVDDVAPVVTWLLSSESSWVTGQIIAVDGGLSSLRAR